MWLKIIRAGFVVFAFAYLALVKPDSSQSFFSGLLIFTAGLAYDYISLYYVGLMEKDNYHKVLGVFGGVINFVFVVFSIFALTHFRLELKPNQPIYIVNDSILRVSIYLNINVVLWFLAIVVPLVGFEIYGEHRRHVGAGISYTRKETLSAK